MRGKAGRCAAVFGLLAAAFAALLAAGVNVGTVSVAPGEVLRILLAGPAGADKAANVVWQIRLPRALAAAVLGGALSVSGFLLQTFFRNPVCGPYVLGISGGAKLLVALVMIVLLRVIPGVPFWGMTAAAFAGSMLVTGLVLVFARRVRGMATLLVVGVMVGSLCTAATDFLITFADEANIASLHSWSVGSFAGAAWPQLGLVSAVVLVGMCASMALSKPMSAYRQGEEYARSLGVNVRAFRAALIGLSCVFSACVTAFAGPVSFVGIAVPHLTRRAFATSEPRVVIPGAFLLGAVFCMGCDLIARTLLAPQELAISTVTAFFGAPAVIALMLRRQRGRDRE